MKDAFHLWGLRDRVTKEVTWVGDLGEAREVVRACREPHESVVKLECRIVQPQRKTKPLKYPNDNFGLPAGYTPNNPNNLTREQVGEGFRLLATVEIGYHRSFSNDTQAWQTARWDDAGWIGALPNATYRVPINTPLDINPELKTK